MAEEIMAILALATDLKDLRTRLGKMICCYSKKAGNLQVSTCILLWAVAIGDLRTSHGRFCDVGKFKFSMNEYECSTSGISAAGRESPSLQMILALQVGTLEVIPFWSLFPVKRDGNNPKSAWGDQWLGWQWFHASKCHQTRWKSLLVLRCYTPSWFISTP